jgi:hypothetical protein
VTLRKLWIIPPAIVLIVVALWLVRARLAADLAENYFQQHGIASSIGFGHLGFAGISGKIALGPADAPDFAADAVEVDFDPLSWSPLITGVRLINPVVRARLDAGGQLTVPGLQQWLDSLASGGGHSRYVSDDLAISFSHLRALLATPGGGLELDGDAKIKRSQLVSAAITAQPTTITWAGATIRIAAADLRLDPASGGYGVTAHFRGGVKNAALEAANVIAQFTAPALFLDLKTKSLSAPTLHLQFTAASFVSGGVTAAKPSVDLTADAVRLGLGTGEGSATLHLAMGADFTPPQLVAQYPVLAKDPRIPRALQANLRHLNIALDANLARKNGALSLSLLQPLQIKGASGGVLRVADFALSGPPSSLRGNFVGAVSGPGLPALSLRAKNFSWQSGVFASDAALTTHFDFAMLHGASIALNGTASFQNGAFAFALGPCAPATLSAFHPGDSDMAQNIKGLLCAAPREKTFTADASGWKFAALAQNVVMAIPLAQAGLSDGAGHIAFSGRGAAVSGKIAVTAAHMTDRVTARRFEPLSGSGDILLDNWVWHGAFTVADTKGNALGTASFSHVLATGSGQMTIAAPHLQFAPDKLQPTMLSPLLGAVSRAQGAARFDGAINWSPTGFQSHGTLAVEKLDFLTPLGTAHAVNATIVLSSLLPPVTAPGQHITISQIDWALPLSGIAVDFSFGGGTLKVESFSTGIAEGNVKLGAISVDLVGAPTVTDTASLNGISLAPLVAASNLGSKIKLEGKVTGSVPFSLGPEGFRIVNGHLASTGPGRISLNRSIWNEGATVSVNAVQDMAYQALENLAFDELTADINSVANGRLQVILHVKGRSDPPKPQQATVAVADIINGTALQKPIQLTSGTPINLTLDTSLNFDELLKSYAEAWSKTLAQAGQSK